MFKNNTQILRLSVMTPFLKVKIIIICVIQTYNFKHVYVILAMIKYHNFMVKIKITKKSRN